MPDYSWPPMDKRRVMGRRTNRLDGIPKASGRMKYAYDINLPGTLYGVLVTSPHAHARITNIDTSAAEKMNGVVVEVMTKPGTEVQWAGFEIAAVAAPTEEMARDAARAVKIDYEVLPHLVREEDLGKAAERSKPSGEKVTGDPDQALKEAEVVSEGWYGASVITHCCLETHGQVIQWKGDQLDYWPSTQALSPIGGDLAKNLQTPSANVHTRMDAMGGGFGSKFSFDRWGVACAQLSKKAGGKPVKLFLDRATDQMIAGNRQAHYAKIKLGAKKDGTITAWQSESWATGGMSGGGMPPIPYVYTTIPNMRLNHTAVFVNAGGQRAWRAPNHSQASYLTCCAMEDLAAKLGVDPLEVFMRNADYTARAEVYRYQLQKGAELMDWKKLWRPRGKSPGTVKRGLGIGVSTWGGAGHASTCRCNIHPDGSVEVELGSQDLGTGTRTVIAMVAAESLGLTVPQIKVKIGDNQFPPSGGSGGSTTVGGVSSSTRKATLNALEKLFETVAPALGTTPGQLEAVEGRIRIKGTPAKALAWKAACQKLGVNKISETGQNIGPKDPAGLISGNVGGIQMSQVSVDTETGIVKILKHVAVHDCGLIINPKTAESQCYGAVIMGICSALCEERIMDPQTGRMLNADMEFYKLAGINDIGEIVVHLDIRPEHDKRGVIGLGEPPVVPPAAAIANAVANAIGVRVPMIPLTPDRVLAALERRS